MIEEFQKRAAAAGLSPEQITTFVKDNQLESKLAAQPTTPADFFAAVVAEANVEKTAASLAYTEGFLKQAISRGLAPEDAVQVTKKALASVFPAIKAEKQAAEDKTDNDLERRAYFSGMYEKAASLGLTTEQTTQLLRKFAQAPVDPGFMLQSLMPPGMAGPGGPLAAASGGEAGAGLAEQLKKLLSRPEVLGGLTGAGVGGLAGGLSGLPGEADPNDPTSGQSHVGRNALLGALAGGGAGAGAGHFAPDMFKRLAA